MHENELMKKSDFHGSSGLMYMRTFIRTDGYSV